MNFSERRTNMSKLQFEPGAEVQLISGERGVFVRYENRPSLVGTYPVAYIELEKPYWLTNDTLVAVEASLVSKGLNSDFKEPRRNRFKRSRVQVLGEV